MLLIALEKAAEMLIRASKIPLNELESDPAISRAPFKEALIDEIISRELDKASEIEALALAAIALASALNAEICDCKELII